MTNHEGSSVGSSLPATANSPRNYWPAVTAGFGGWLLEAFDFFLVTFCLTSMAKDFNKTVPEIAVVLLLTMLFRPVGGFIFGFLADRYGRRGPLMINLGFFVVAEILTGLAPSYFVLLVVRSLFGIVMGGNWGLGATLALESVPVEKRGTFSGILQEGYAAGNLVAALSFLFFFGRFNGSWRPMFFLGCIPCILLIIFIQLKVKETKVWKAAQAASWGEQWSEVLSHWKIFLAMIGFMTMMLFASHGTQDLYPTFLERQWHFTPHSRAVITAISALGGILGGVVFGYIQDKFHWGRRRTIITALVIGIFIVPIWAYAPNEAALMVGAFLMQFMVQGAWGVVPVYLAEMSPNSVRGLLPGFAYQTAGVISGWAPYIEARAAEKFNYAAAMAATAVVVFILASVTSAASRERRNQAFED